MNHIAHIYTQTKEVSLRPFEERDSLQLFKICSDPKTQHLWAPNTGKLSWEKFQKKLVRRIDYRWSHYLVFESRIDQKILGFAYCYNVTPMCVTGYLCIYL